MTDVSSFLFFNTRKEDCLIGMFGADLMLWSPSIFLMARTLVR